MSTYTTGRVATRRHEWKKLAIRIGGKVGKIKQHHCWLCVTVVLSKVSDSLGVKKWIVWSKWDRRGRSKTHCSGKCLFRHLWAGLIWACLFKTSQKNKYPWQKYLLRIKILFQRSELPSELLKVTRFPNKDKKAPFPQTWC